MSSRLAPLRVLRPTGTHSGTVLFFHGSGSNADDVSDGIAFVMRKYFSFPHLKVVFPTAPLRRYTPLDGELSNVWFDRLAISSSVPEHVESIEEIGKEIKELIKQENDLGIPNNRIVVGGISMGGALAMYTGLKWNTSVAGIFAFSSFLNNGSMVFKHLEETKPTSISFSPELLQFHGVIDDLVPLESAKETYEKLKSLGVDVKLMIDEYGEHMPNRNQLSEAYSWVLKKLPPL